MTPNDRPRFAALITALSELYDKPFSGPLIDMYWRGLAQYDIEAVEKSVELHIRNPDTGQFRPKIGDLVKMIEGTTSDRAQLAWARVHAAVRMVGPYVSVVFDDAVIHAVIEDMGGWVKLCDCKSDEMPFRGKEFENRYRGYAIRRETPPHLPKLTGIAEQQNRTDGYIDFIPDPVLIGDKQRALAVLESGQSSRATFQAIVAPLKALKAHTNRDAEKGASR